mgnify:CR=1 FL=1
MSLSARADSGEEASVERQTHLAALGLAVGDLARFVKLFFAGRPLRVFLTGMTASPSSWLCVFTSLALPSNLTKPQTHKVPSRQLPLPQLGLDLLVPNLHRLHNKPAAPDPRPLPRRVFGSELVARQLDPPARLAVRVLESSSFADVHLKTLSSSSAVDVVHEVGLGLVC